MKTTMKPRRRKVAIAGSVGIPAQYGGFETLAENLVRYAHGQDLEIIVYCSGMAYEERLKEYEGAKLVYIPLPANGAGSILYDMWSLIDASLRGVDDVFLLGHGGSFALPFIKSLSSMRVFTNIDGIEWRRDKWSKLARSILRTSESFAVRHSDVVIADNEAIREYVTQHFGRKCVVIPYGGDQALKGEADPSITAGLPARFALSLCRIEPENNVEMILRAFSRLDHPLVFVGNWDASDYGRQLKAEFQGCDNIVVHDPIYDPQKLRAVRERANLYVHGHSAGGTNPSLVEMMHFEVPVLARDCSFNRYTTEGRAHYFTDEVELADLVRNLPETERNRNARLMREIARRLYTWDRVGEAYFGLLSSPD